MMTAGLNKRQTTAFEPLTQCGLFGLGGRGFNWVGVVWGGLCG